MRVFKRLEKQQPPFSKVLASAGPAPPHASPTDAHDSPGTQGLSTCLCTSFDWVSFGEFGLGLHTNVSTRYPGCYLTRPAHAERRVRSDFVPSTRVGDRHDGYHPPPLALTNKGRRALLPAGRGALLPRPVLLDKR